MMALVHSKNYENHDTGIHPENKDRIRVIIDEFENQGILNQVGFIEKQKEFPEFKDKIDVIHPEMASCKDILRVHEESYIQYLKSFCNSGGGHLDFDTVVSHDSFDIAKLAAGGAITASELILNGYDVAYSLARPPGHHATREKAMGFCLINNLAVAIHHLKNNTSIKKFLVFDFDAHYGNGNAEIFIKDPNVLYISIHQDPKTIFPGSGFIDETGAGEGEGFNMNIPMPPGSNTDDYIYILERILEPVAKEFGAEFYFLEVGFDGHKNDPLSRLNLDDEFYPWISSKMMDIAGKMVLLLEGGYNYDALVSCNMKMINVLKNTNDVGEDIYNNSIMDSNVSSETRNIFNEIEDVFSSFYEF